MYACSLRKLVWVGIFSRLILSCTPEPFSALNQQIGLYQDETAEIELQVSGSNSDVSYTATKPAHGVLSGTAPLFTYKPNLGYVGQDQFTFTATSGELVADPGRTRQERAKDTAQ